MSASSNASRVFHRTLNREFPIADRSAGAYIHDSGGKQYLDASGGAAVSCLGHGHPKVIAAIKQQLDRMAFAHTSFFSNEPAEQLAEILSSKAPGGTWRTYFLSGGSEANEAALKLTRQIQVERGEASRDHFITRMQSYHGNTIGALSVGGRLANQKVFGPILTQNVRKIMPCFHYRWAEDGEARENFATRAASALEDEIAEIGADRTIAFIAETVVGATLGSVPPEPGYFKAVRETCDRHGVLMIIDEVMCGMGRCGTLFACEQDGVVPDVITLAKGLGGGYQPISAMMVREELVAELEKGSGAFSHGHTYVGHATACAAGLAVQQVFEEEDLITRSARMGMKLRSALEDAFGEHPRVGDIRGRGLFQALEIVEDRETKQAFPPSRNLAARLKKTAQANGLITYPFAGTVDGTAGDHILLAPPFIVTDDQIGELIEKLTATVGEVLSAG